MCIFEIKALMIFGEYPGIPNDRNYLESTGYTLNYIWSTGTEKLYTFKVSDEVLTELTHICEVYRKRFIDRNLNSLDMIDMVEGGLS